MEVKVIETIKNYLKEFNTPVEFNLWYAKNKDEVDKLTTHKLNKMYHIVGYRITKIKGILMLKEDKKVKNEEENEDIYELKAELEKIKETVNKIINFINANFQGTIEVSTTE